MYLKCVGPSMLPTFYLAGDVLLIDKTKWNFRRKVELGDVIICVSPSDPLSLVNKRVVGLPGDRVCVDPSVEPREYITVKQL